MAICISVSDGNIYYADLAIADARAAIASGSTLRVWWWSSWGHRFSEEIWLPEDSVRSIRTESDDG